MIKRAIKLLRLQPNKERLGSPRAVFVSKYQKASPSASEQTPQQNPKGPIHQGFAQFLATSRLFLILLPMVAFFVLAYNFDQEKMARREIAYQKIKNLKPLYYEGQPMAREWARKAVKDLEYTKKWYSCLGEGLVTVLLITLL